ncbi:hypothetical protein ACWE42_06855 [Sutcliffiella cohnii]
MKKGLFLLLIIILSIGSLLLGKLHWNNKLQASVLPIDDNNIVVSETEIQHVEEEVETSTVQNALKHANQLPSPLKEKMVEIITNEEKINFAILGSKGLNGAKESWPSLVNATLTQEYGNVIEWNVKELTGFTSSDIVERELHGEHIAAYDVLLLEPFFLEDNFGLIPLPERFANIESIINDYKQWNEELIVMIQPSIPWHNGVNYPREIDALKQYAEEQGYIYLNHWENWPDYTDEVLLQYVSDDRLQPNIEGNNVWAEYLINFFLSAE